MQTRKNRRRQEKNGEEEKRTRKKKNTKNIMAENAQATRHYKNRGLRQLSRTPWFEHRKESILEKAVTKFGFGGRDRIHYISSGFVCFFPKTQNTDFGPKQGGH